MQLTNVFRLCLLQLPFVVDACAVGLPEWLPGDAYRSTPVVSEPALHDARSDMPWETTLTQVPVAPPGSTWTSSITSATPPDISASGQPCHFSGHGSNATLQLTNVFRLCLLQLPFVVDACAVGLPKWLPGDAYRSTPVVSEPALHDARSDMPWETTLTQVPVAPPWINLDIFDYVSNAA
ncbi:hypothetical protein MRX96_001118 [Rhipicephalus microplus]